MFRNSFEAGQPNGVNNAVLTLTLNKWTFTKSQYFFRVFACSVSVFCVLYAPFDGHQILFTQVFFLALCKTHQYGEFLAYIHPYLIQTENGTVTIWFCCWCWCYSFLIFFFVCCFVCIKAKDCNELQTDYRRTCPSFLSEYFHKTLLRISFIVFFSLNWMTVCR